MGDIARPSTVQPKETNSMTQDDTYYILTVGLLIGILLLVIPMFLIPTKKDPKP